MNIAKILMEIAREFLSNVSLFWKRMLKFGFQFESKVTFYNTVEL